MATRSHPVVRRLEQTADRALASVVSRASTALHGRWYYANRWHPHNALLQDALDETVAYIKQHMSEAMICRDAFEVLTRASKQVRIDGLYLEFGVRTGTTINHVARANPRSTIHGFDSFQGLPEAWTGWTMDAGAFRRHDLPTVEPNVELHVGWFDDTLPAFLAADPSPVAFVHIDSDIYSSARTVLRELAPRLRPGSMIVFNEYFNYPNWMQHEFRAFREFCDEYDVRYRYVCWGMYEVAVEIESIGPEATDTRSDVETGTAS
jgi:hypothetical protein